LNTISLLLIAVSLSLDALAVSVATGCGVKDLKTSDAFKMAGFFGGFQALMPALGWLAGVGARQYIETWDHWIACGILSVIGGKMIFEATVLKKEEKQAKAPGHFELLALAVATSIDALAVGVSFSMLEVDIVYPALVIGAVTFAICLTGVHVGRKFGHIRESWIEVVGGGVLIGIGVKIVIDHCCG
jgi:manganese efflux pump family protein